MSGIRQFVERHYHHFNASEFKRAARSYVELIEEKKGKMFVTLAGAMSSARIGISLAQAIRQGKVHAICSTGANLEEDVYRLVAHSSYENVPNWRQLTNEMEQEFLDRHAARVADTLIPEEEAMKRISRELIPRWWAAKKAGERKFPHEFLIDSLEDLKPYDAPEEDSWLLAAAEMKIPIFVPGWEDSTSGNMFAGMVIKDGMDPLVVKGGIEYMKELADWFRAESAAQPLGYFQIGGGITGDFAICVAPMLRYDAEEENTPHWSYFAQISDSTPSYGSYSGALPGEKISWGKCEKETQVFMIESDASIVAPLMFEYVLDEPN
ncbi:MAG: deoxyhypusine synthase [Verrucomicrobiales bacterium]|jgi:deoxyhypusine synthase